LSLISYYDFYGEEFRAKEDCSRPLLIFISPSPTKETQYLHNKPVGEGVHPEGFSLKGQRG
jgi:hypothetical protein